jgi:hypothetical protein
LSPCLHLCQLPSPSSFPFFSFLFPLSSSPLLSSPLLSSPLLSPSTFFLSTIYNKG